MPSKRTLIGIGNSHGMDLMRKPYSLRVWCKLAMSLEFLAIDKPQSNKFSKWQANFPLNIFQSLKHLLIFIPPSDKLQ